MSLIFNQSVEVLRPKLVRDPYNPKRGTASFDDPEIVAYPHLVSVQPVSTSEDSGRAGTLTTVFMLYTPIGFDIDLRAGDRVRVGGSLVLDVDGTPMKWPDPFTGRVHHVEARLKVIHG